MIVKDKTDAKVEAQKASLNLTGDVYIVDGKFMESLASHKKLVPSSKATTIEEAEAERIEYEKEQAELLRLAREQSAQNEDEEPS